MRKIISLALLNIKQCIREKTFWGAGFFFLFLLAFSLFLGELSIGEKDIVLRNVSLSAIEISGLVLIVLGLVYNFYREKDTRLKEVYLSYFSHTSYLAGKLVGYVVVCFTYVSLASLLASLFLWLNKAFLWQFFIGSYSLFLKLSIFSSICLFFSCIFEYPLLASASTMFAYIASEFSYNALKITSVTKNEFFRYIFGFLYHFLPSADKIDLKYQAIHGQAISLVYFLNISFYVLLYILLCFFLTGFIFLGKEH